MTPPIQPASSSMARAGKVDPSVPGAPWWAYRRPPLSPAPTQEPKQIRSSTPSSPESPQADTTRQQPTVLVPEYGPYGHTAFIVCVSLVAATFMGTRFLHIEGLGVWILPAAGFAGVVSLGQRAVRVHPDEPWLPRLLLLGLVAKLVGTYFRYFTFNSTYDKAGDAIIYDQWGRQLVAQWTGGPRAPDLANLQSTNFIKWFTGVTYYLFGQNIVGAFFVFGLLAFIGSYFWYRALVDAVPFVNRRLFFIFLMFAPSIVFWPASIGKEALMQLGLGAIAWATSLAYRGRFLRALPLVAGGGWLLFVVRPHLLALVTLAAAVPYFFGRIGAGKAGSILSRPVGMVAVGLLVVFTVTAGAKFLGIQNLSVDSVQEQLNQETERTSEGGSQFSHGSNSLSPLTIPNGVATVLLRPFPWEAAGGLQLLASLEGAAVVGLIVYRFASIRLAFKRFRRYPFIFYCLVLLLLYSMTFSSFANFGLLNRQRSLVLPALYALIALEPALARGEDRLDYVAQPNSVSS